MLATREVQLNLLDFTSQISNEDSPFCAAFITTSVTASEAHIFHTATEVH
jgi:hypothetical protein